jgi:hypothetical protein
VTIEGGPLGFLLESWETLLPEDDGGTCDSRLGGNEGAAGLPPLAEASAVLSAAGSGGAIDTGPAVGSNNGGRNSNWSTGAWFAGGSDARAGRFPGRINRRIKPVIRAVEGIRALPC